MTSSSSKFYIQTFLGVVSAIIGYIYLEQLDPNAKPWSKDWINYYFMVPFLILLTFFLIRYLLLNIFSLPAIISQFKKAKIRGLWENDLLDKQIVKSFSKAEEVKIKLTRGYNTFCKENANFYKIFSESYIGNISSREGQRRIKVLLHFPCHHSDHLESRSEVNNIKESAYLKSIHSTILKLNSINKKYNKKILVKLKFYGDVNYKWRYFIFQKSLAKKILFINHYESKRSGIKSPMLKVYNDATLCDDFDETHDNIYDKYSCTIQSLKDLNVDEIRGILGCRRDCSKCKECVIDFRNKFNEYESRISID